MITFLRTHLPKCYCKRVERKAIKFDKRLRRAGVPNNYFEAVMICQLISILLVVGLIRLCYMAIVTMNVDSRINIALVGLIAILGLRVAFLIVKD